MTDNEIIKEIQGIKESMKRHIDLTNEMGQDLLRIDEEYTGGSKVWLTTDYFKKVVKHFCHSNYLVKCLELVFDYINRLQAENERLQNILLSFTSKVTAWSNKKGYDTTELSLIAILDESKNVTANIKAEAYKEFAERLKEKAMAKYKTIDNEYLYEFDNNFIDNLLKELVGDNNAILCD